MTATYEALQEEAARLADIAAALGLLSWDQEVMMPAGAAARRAQQIGTLATLHHNRLVNHLQPLVDALDPESTQYDETQRRNLLQLRYTLSRAVALPEAFVGKLAVATSHAQHAWEAAKKASDFSQFAPVLSEVVALKKEEAEYYGYQTTAYDALLDTYDPGLTTARVEEVFGALIPPLKELLAKTQNATPVDEGFLRTPVDVDRQWQYTLDVLGQLGYDFNRGRQDRSTHPFSIGLGMDDVRVTTRVDKDDVLMAVSSSIHECGHALYEQGLNPAHYGLPGAEACSLSIHESQSRLWENNVGRSKAFWQGQWEAFKALFPDQLAGKTVEDLYRAANAVRPSLIRIAADELTYHLHIVLRFELEKQLIGGEIKVADLPAAWNAGVQRLLGIDVPDDAHGVLQDVHWSHGSFGYFPTYSLGSLFAAQLYTKAQAALPGLEAGFAERKFAPLLDWLRTHVHSQGRLYDSEEVCRRATGEGLNPSYFIDYLAAKLTEVYRL